MKSLFLCLAAVSLAGCSAASMMTRPGPQLIVQSPTVVRGFANGDSVGVLRKGDTLTALAGHRYVDFITGGTVGEYLIAYRNDSGYVKWPGVFEAWEAVPTHFTLPLSQDKDAWARANYYVGEHATMKIQVSTDYKIETFNTITDDDRSFAISRLPQGDQVTYDVSAGGDDAYRQKHLCARFVRTGE